MVLLDTDIMIDLLRQYEPAVTWFIALDNEEIALPGYVAMELIQGCRNKLEQAKIEAALRPCRMVWPTPDMCQAALSSFAQFRLSHNLGLLDALIGQTAVALDMPLYSFNTKHYAALPSLKVVEPYQRVP